MNHDRDEARAASEPDREPGWLETDAVPVRLMRAEDLEAVVEIDAASSGRRRRRYFETLVRRAVEHADLQISLVAELEGRVVGFLVGSLYYGEFGVVEPFATMDAIGVHPEWRRRHVARALLEQFRRNLGALGIGSIRTEVAWDDFDLLAFVRASGFEPAPRLCLECPLDPTLGR